MTDEAMKAHLAAALGIAVERERERVDALLADMDENIRNDAGAMRPVIEALRCWNSAAAMSPVSPSVLHHMATWPSSTGARGSVVNIFE